MIQLIYKEEAPQRLDSFLLDQLPTIKPGQLHKYLRQNKIKLNGKKQALGTRLQKGDCVCLYLPRQDAAVEPQIEVLFEDRHLLAVNKPAGVASMGARESLDTPDPAGTMLARIRHYALQAGQDMPGGLPMLCHRLDTGTSGVLLAAKTSEALEFVDGLVRSHRLRKLYSCVVHGLPKPAAGTLEGWLQKDAKQAHVTIHSGKKPGARPVQLHYTTAATQGPLVLLCVELITGRTHQIRAQLAAAGTPILGDSRYGSNTLNRRYRLKHQCLCAMALCFPTGIEGPFAQYSGLEIHCREPWYVPALREGRFE